MGKLIDGDDGLPAEEVGVWAKEKHDCQSASKFEQVSASNFEQFQRGRGRRCL